MGHKRFSSHPVFIYPFIDSADYFLSMYVLAEEETLTLASRILHCLDALPSSQMCFCKNPSFCPSRYGCNPGLLFSSLPGPQGPSSFTSIASGCPSDSVLYLWFLYKAANPHFLLTFGHLCLTKGMSIKCTELSLQTRAATPSQPLTSWLGQSESLLSLGKRMEGLN